MNLAILHYLPLEYYPPTTNLINYLASERIDDFKQIKVYSTQNIKGRQVYQIIDSTNEGKAKRFKTPISLFRSPFPTESDKGFIRLLKYLHYNIFTLLRLICYRANVLVYYESYSAWPAYVYTKFFNRNCRLFIHMHEYASKDWYASTMKQVQYFHRLEKKWLYPRAHWISQTNTDRLQFFHSDHPYLKKEQLRIMPNYPPKTWLLRQAQQPDQTSNIEHQTSNILRLVYVGSLSFQSTYLKELCEWVLTQNGKIQFDVYAYNLYDNVKAYLKDLDSPFINYYEQGVEYNNQPELLSKYDVGLILYKAHNHNYTYNAPNKLFEYLACDLDVWFPDVLKGPAPYITKDNYPKVLPVDYENLDQFNWQKAIDKVGLEYKASEYFCEGVYKELVDEIIGQ